MAKADNNKESGADEAPVLTEEKRVEITPKVVAELKAKNEELKDEITFKSNEIETQKETVSIQGGILNDQAEKIAQLEEIVEKQKQIISDKDAVIVEDKKLIEAQKEEIIQLLKDQVELSKLIPEDTVDAQGFVILDNKDLVLIRFLLSPAGKFKLPYNVGQEVAMHSEVAAEIVEARYAEYVLEEE